MRKVLIADDSLLNRTMLRNILEQDYEILEASDGEEALEIIRLHSNTISAVLLDIVMPRVDGYEVLKKMSGTLAYARIPIIICSGSESTEVIEKVYAYGAAGFLTKPFNPTIILNYLHTIIRICEMTAIKNTIMSDRLTGLLTGEAFFEKLSLMVYESAPNSYILECIDIDNFKAINNLYGIEEGNFVLRQMAEEISRMCEHIGGISGHIFADNFAVLYPNNPDAEEYVTLCRESLYIPIKLHDDICVSAGRYIIDDLSLTPNAMYDYASMAKHSVKGMYDKHLAYFDDEMRKTIIESQFITRDMNKALQNKQFEIWLQPQINHATGAMTGAEALVRWRHPEKGLISPATFIPIFEQNGFIYELDKYVWEHVCILLRNWIDKGKDPLPVSVNISQDEILKDDFLKVIQELVMRYDIPVNMLRLEITESVLAHSKKQLVQTINELKSFGFVIEIDDFGSAYSSLNTLKDVPADIIKLDMMFFQETGTSQRAGNIVESVVRMVKWLGMSVLAEGVETKKQADFLRTVGCNYLQGYLYSKPLPVTEFELFMENNHKEKMSLAMETVENLDNNAFWDPNSMETLIFNSYVGGAAIIEFHNGSSQIVRTNDRFVQEFGGASIKGVPIASMNLIECLDEENLKIMDKNIYNAIETKKESTCEICISGLDSGASGVLYFRCTVRMIAWTGDRQLLYTVIHNITAQRLAEQRELSMYIELLNNLPCGAGLYEYDGKSFKAVHLNGQYWELVGRDPVKCENINVLDAMHPEDIDSFYPEIIDAMSQNRDAISDIRIRYANEGYRKFHVVMRIRPKANAIYSLYAFFLPVNEESLLLEEQNRSKRDKHRLDFLFKNAAISVWSYNFKTKKIIQNERSKKMHGYDTVVSDVPESLIRDGFIHPDSVRDYLEMYNKLKNGALEAEGVFRVRTADRTGYWFEHIRYAALNGVNDNSGAVFAISNDVSVEYEQNNAIHKWMELISDMQVEKNAICEFNLTEDKLVRKQGNLFNEFDFSPHDKFDTYVRKWALNNVCAEDLKRVLNYVHREKLMSIHERGVLDGGIDYRINYKDKPRWCSLSIKFIKYPADDDVRLIMVHTDIHASREEELRQIEESKRDPMTGVLNRRTFEKEVDKIIKQNPEAFHSMFMIDIDNFKSINESFGHATGDQVLKKTAERLYSILKSEDLVGRIGGDEFMIFLKNTPYIEEIRARAQSILEIIQTVMDQNLKISGSMGIAVSPGDGISFEQLYRSAEKAEYYAKQNGKNRYTFFEELKGRE